MREGNRFPRRARLRRREEIVALLASGTRRRSGPVEVFVASSTGSRSRAGLVVPRYGHSVVQRNKVKRRLREVLRLEWLPRAAAQPSPRDILVRAGPGAFGASFGALRSCLLACIDSEP